MFACLMTRFIGILGVMQNGHDGSPSLAESHVSAVRWRQRGVGRQSRTSLMA
jgi:hypothetical protein